MCSVANLCYLLYYNIGLDGGFIKFSLGQQILVATGRDGNNNIFPIAFGVIDKEDTTSWCWFLTQLKYSIGDHGKFGNYTSYQTCRRYISDALFAYLI